MHRVTAFPRKLRGKCLKTLIARLKTDRVGQTVIESDYSEVIGNWVLIANGGVFKTTS